MDNPHKGCLRVVVPFIGQRTLTDHQPPPTTLQRKTYFGYTTFPPHPQRANTNNFTCAAITILGLCRGKSSWSMQKLGVLLHIARCGNNLFPVVLQIRPLATLSLTITFPCPHVNGLRP